MKINNQYKKRYFRRDVLDRLRAAAQVLWKKWLIKGKSGAPLPREAPH